MKREEKFKRDLKKLFKEYHCYLSVNIDLDQVNDPYDTADLVVNFMNKNDIVKYDTVFEKIQIVLSKDGARFFNSM